MFNWVTVPWVTGSIAILIALAFFWPQNRNAPQNAFKQLNKENHQVNLNPAITTERTNTFSRADDTARLETFKEIEKFDKKIRTLLDEAQSLVDKKFYTLPEDRNAILVYQEVLELSPNNSTAQQGIENISARLLAIGQRALENNTLSTANLTLQKLINIDQESEQTIELTWAISNWHEKKKIINLVIAGNAAYEKYDYIAPATKNALYFYEKALEQDPSNQQAKAGIAKIVDIYRKRTRGAIDARLYNQASTNLEILIELDGNDPLIPGFQAVLKEILATQQATEPENTDASPSVNE